MILNYFKGNKWCWAMFKATQDLNFNNNSKIDTSPYHFVTGQHVLLYPHLATMRSTALLKLRPDDGRPYRLPNTWL